MYQNQQVPQVVVQQPMQMHQIPTTIMISDDSETAQNLFFCGFCFPFLWMFGACCVHPQSYKGKKYVRWMRVMLTLMAFLVVAIVVVSVLISNGTIPRAGASQ